MATRISLPGITPFGTARYPKINNPDTKGKFADNKYKTELVLDDEDAKDYKKVLRDFAAKALPDVENPHLPIKTDKKDGTVAFIFKSKKQPLVKDAGGPGVAPKKVDLSKVLIRGGSEIRIAYILTAYEKGISAWLEGVQIKKLAEGVPEFSGIDDEGYSYEDDGEPAAPEGGGAATGKDAFAL